MPNNSDNVFQISEIMKTGAFVGRCTEMCGTYHSMMNFEVRVVEPNDFKAYMQQRIAGQDQRRGARWPSTSRRRRSPPIRSTPAAASRRRTAQASK